MRPNELGNEQIRVTIRLPLALYRALVGVDRRYFHTSGGGISRVVRQALDHFLECPALRDAEGDARARHQLQPEVIQQQIAAWTQELEALEAAREARRQRRRERSRS